MSDISIRVEGLSKSYRLGERQPYKSLRESITNAVRRPFGGQGAKADTFWALQDVSLEVRHGDVLGVIGRNGAGKSTLLKILSRITAPTKGRAEIHGRIGSLLEVGTGFHPELSGRENIFLNGAILGMSRVEIVRKFEEIVAFAEVEKFIDTPVKRYSSGMYVRLAFAVAAHLETEILLVDEVLAVGDSEFQKKCLGKMGEISRKGRTVLFVSHNMGAISTLTERSLWLDEGTVQAFGTTRKVVETYISVGYRPARVWTATEENHHPMQILRVELEPESPILDVREGFQIRIDYVVRRPTQGAVVSAIIHATDHTPILSTEDVDTSTTMLDNRRPGHYRTSVKIPGDWLAAGTYLLRLHCGVVNHAIFDDISALQFELTETGNPKLRMHKRAFILPYLPWSTEDRGSNNGPA